MVQTSLVRTMWQNSDFQEKLQQKKIVCKFNPAAAPHFGGSWERMVKTCKQANYHVLYGQRPTDELSATILCLTEQLLNSRPLTPNCNGPSDMKALTPFYWAGRVLLFHICQMSRSTKITGKCSGWLWLTWTNLDKMVERVPFCAHYSPEMVQGR